MSREFRVSVKVAGLRNHREAGDVEEALCQEWPLDLHVYDEKSRGSSLEGWGDGSMGGGLKPEELAAQLRRRAWTAAQRYLEVNVYATRIDDPESYPGSKEEFEVLRDGGALDRKCWVCDNDLEFGATDDMCETCRAEEDRAE